MKLADVKGISTEEAEKHLDLSLAADGLCGLAWFNRGVRKSVRNDYYEALISFLMAGLVQPNDIGSWSNVLICIFNCDEHKNLMPLVISTAYRVNGEDFIRKFGQVIEENPEDRLPKFVKTELINIVGSYARELNKDKSQSSIIRFFNPDGTY